MERVKLIFFHGGRFQRSPNLEYIDGQSTEYFDDPSELCTFWLFDLAKKCENYEKIEGLYFLLPDMSLDYGLKMVNGDEDVKEMIHHASKKRVIQLYVSHEVDEHDLIVNVQSFPVPVNNSVQKLPPRRSHKVNDVGLNLVSHNTFTTTTIEDIHISDYEIYSKDDTEARSKDDSESSYYDIDDESEFESFYEHPLIVNDKKTGKLKDRKGKEKSIREHSSTEEDDGSEQTIVSQSDTSDDEFRNSRVNLLQWNKTKAVAVKRVTNNILINHGNMGDEDTLGGIRSDNVPESEYEESEGDLNSGSGSDGELISQKKERRKVPIVNKYTKFNTFKWCLGMRFPNKATFRDAVIRYGIAQGFPLKICKSDTERGGRLGIACEGDCPFRLYASWEAKRACYVLKSINQEHECHRDMKRNSCFKSKWAANEFIEVFKEKPHWPASDIVKAVREKFGIIIARGVAYKIKYFAHRMLHGSMLEHYSKIGRYLAALRNTSPSTIIDLVTIPDPEIPRNPCIFQRLYFCFDALRNGFLEGCRPVLCLDGSFLKTFLKGVLLTAIGRDGNNQMFPVAWAVAEGENNDSWEWFVGNLKLSFKGADGEKWTFMSDEHPSILGAVSKIFPKAEHRHCARHIYQHWKRTYKGDEFKMHFWNVVGAYNLADYNQALDEMALVSSIAVEAFKALNPKTFCRAFLKTDSKCDIVVNNMAETFNGWIIQARSKHILYMLDDIRCQVMERLCKKRVEMQSWKTICPRVQEKLEKEKDEARNCFPVASDFMEFQVPHKLDTLVVDMNKRTCTCRKWDLSGIPCCHAVACAFYLRQKAEEYVSEYLKKATYVMSYSCSIAPCPGERHWPIANLPMQPPLIRAAPGRPKKKRRKDPFEDPKRHGKLTKHGQVMHCSVCKSTAHTKRTCPNKNNVPEPIPKKQRGRPRKSTLSSHENTQPSVLNTTAEPSRRGRGRSRGGGREAGNNRGGSGRGKNARRDNVPRGFGVYINDQGTTFTNTARQNGPVNISHRIVPSVSTQASITQEPSSHPSCKT